MKSNLFFCEIFAYKNRNTCYQRLAENSSAKWPHLQWICTCLYVCFWFSVLLRARPFNIDTPLQVFLYGRLFAEYLSTFSTALNPENIFLFHSVEKHKSPAS